MECVAGRVLDLAERVRDKGNLRRERDHGLTGERLLEILSLDDRVDGR